MLLKDIAGFILDCLFPLECKICRAPQNPNTNPEGFVCQSCFSDISLHAWVFCPVCNKKCIGYAPCKSHAVSLRFLGVASSYQNRILKQLLWDYKYRFIEPLHTWLAMLLNAYYDATLHEYIQQNKTEWICVPIPLSAQRLRWRGFNQAELLAQEFSRHTGIPCISCLKRIAFKKPQMQLGTRELRFENIKDVFALEKNAAGAGKRIILIDDIATSGATLLEASRTLKQGKAKEVIGLVVARNDSV